MATDLTKYNPIATGYSVWNQYPNFERDNPGYLPNNYQSQNWYDIGHIVYLSKDISNWPIGMKPNNEDITDKNGIKIQKDRYYKWTGWDKKDDTSKLYSGWEYMKFLSSDESNKFNWLDYEKNNDEILND